MNATNTTHDWGYLVAKNRAKSVGVPWTEEEAIAVFQFKIPADFVRLGCLTQEDYSKMQQGAEKQEKETGEKPLVLQNKEQLLEKAKNLGIHVDENVKTTRNDLIMAIRNELEKQSLLKENA